MNIQRFEALSGRVAALAVRYAEHSFADANTRYWLDQYARLCRAWHEQQQKERQPCAG